MGFIQKLANDAALAKQTLVNLDAWKKELQRLQTERKAILQRRWSARSKIATLRTAFASKASTVLGSALKDLTLSLKFVTDGYSPDAENLVTSAMGWKTVQVPRAAILIGQLTVPKLIDAVRAQNSHALTSLQSAPGIAAFSKGEADAILNRLNTPELLHALERILIDDFPKLTVTRMVKVPGQAPKPRIRDFTQLSLGQQQSVLLALMLSSDRTQPIC